MKRLVFLLLLIVASHAVAQTDALILTTGERRPGRIVSVDAQAYAFEVQVVAGQPPATIRVARNFVSQVEFGPDPARDALISRASVAQLAVLAAQWQRFEPFLGIARAPAAPLGLRYAHVLLETKEPADAAKALALFMQIEADAWNPDDRTAARQGRLRALVATGKSKEAIAEARELLESAKEAGLLIEAKYILAREVDEKLHQLVEDNPRWEEDDRVRPERHRLYNEAVDFYLYPLLFHGGETESTARGLWKLVELYRFTDEPQLALETARDIAVLYPETKPATSATAWMNTLTPAQKAVDFEQEARAAIVAKPAQDQAPAAESAPTPSTPTKRKSK